MYKIILNFFELFINSRSKRIWNPRTDDIFPRELGMKIFNGYIKLFSLNIFILSIMESGISVKIFTKLKFMIWLKFQIAVGKKKKDKSKKLKNKILKWLCFKALKKVNIPIKNPVIKKDDLNCAAPIRSIDIKIKSITSIFLFLMRKYNAIDVMIWGKIINLGPDNNCKIVGELKVKIEIKINLFLSLTSFFKKDRNRIIDKNCKTETKLSVFKNNAIELNMSPLPPTFA